jgi:Protein of unknown function (DUF4238)
MARTKHQHFVPKLYLRLFASDNDGKFIGIYNLLPDLFIAQGALKHQAYKNFFYGEDGKVEDILQELESEAAPILREIVREQHLPITNSEKHVNLFLFVLILRCRTKSNVDHINEGVDSFMQHVFSNDDRINKILPEYKIGLTSASGLAVKHAIEALPSFIDMKCKLIVNTSNLPFITSDHPVAFLNPYLNERISREMGKIGVASKGLLVFLPISPKHALLIYDSNIYGVGVRKSKEILIQDESEIEKMNALQVINCDENLYFGSNINR